MTAYDPLPDARAPWFGLNHVRPGKDTYLVLRYNHEGGSPFCTEDDVNYRLHYIRTVKPEAERPARLRNFGIIPWSEDLMSRLAEFERVARQTWVDYHQRGQAQIEYERVRSQAWARISEGLHVISVDEWEARP